MRNIKDIYIRLIKIFNSMILKIDINKYVMKSFNYVNYVNKYCVYTLFQTEIE